MRDKSRMALAQTESFLQETHKLPEVFPGKTGFDHAVQDAPDKPAKRVLPAITLSRFAGYPPRLSVPWLDLARDR